MYPDRDTLSNVSRSGYITARDQSMVESGVTEGGKNTASFLFREWTQQLEHLLTTDLGHRYKKKETEEVLDFFFAF